MSDRVKLAREIAARTEPRFIGDQAPARKSCGARAVERRDPWGSLGYIDNAVRSNGTGSRLHPQVRS